MREPKKPSVASPSPLSPSLFILMGLLLSVITGCCLDPVNGDRYICLGEMSSEEEARLGKEYAPNFIAESGGVYPDQDLYNYLNDIVITKMAKNSHRAELPWRFTILNTSQINAFALPGGEVFVTRGLLARLESEAQFAHLMGHEIGHVSHRHSVRGQTRQQMVGLLLGISGAAEQAVFETEGTPFLTSTLGIAGQLALLKFGRDQELQSDQRGVDYAIQAGYDPRESVKTFEMFLALKRQAGQNPGLVDALLSSHPPDERRVSEIEAYLTENHPDVAQRGDLIVSRPQWTSFMNEVRAAQNIYQRYDQAMALVQKAREEENQAGLDEAETLLRGGARQLPSHASFPVGLGIVALERDDANGAIGHLSRALNLDPDHFEGHFYRGIAHRQRGNNNEALTDLGRAHKLFPMSPVPCFLLGEVELAQDRREEAVRWYRATLERAPGDSSLGQRAQARLSELGVGSAAS